MMTFIFNFVESEIDSRNARTIFTIICGFLSVGSSLFTRVFPFREKLHDEITKRSSNKIKKDKAHEEEQSLLDEK